MLAYVSCPSNGPTGQDLRGGCVGFESGVGQSLALTRGTIPSLSVSISSSEKWAHSYLLQMDRKNSDST